MAMDSETKKKYAEFLRKGSKDLIDVIWEDSADNVDILETIYGVVRAGFLRRKTEKAV